VATKKPKLFFTSPEPNEIFKIKKRDHHFLIVIFFCLFAKKRNLWALEYIFNFFFISLDIGGAQDTLYRSSFKRKLFFLWKDISFFLSFWSRIHFTTSSSCRYFNDSVLSNVLLINLDMKKSWRWNKSHSEEKIFGI